jgi:hypothetical protein
MVAFSETERMVGDDAAGRRSPHPGVRTRSSSLGQRWVVAHQLASRSRPTWPEWRRYSSSRSIRMRRAGDRLAVVGGHLGAGGGIHACPHRLRAGDRVVPERVQLVGLIIDRRAPDSEDGAFWTALLRSLKMRGLRGVQLVISDAHTGLKQAISAVPLGAAPSFQG